LRSPALGYFVAAGVFAPAIGQTLGYIGMERIGVAVVNTGAILSFFSALHIGKIVRIEPLVACNPLLTFLWAAIFLRAVEQLSIRMVVGACVTVTGTVVVVTAK
jgi:uncharacterized membrane protein